MTWSICERVSRWNFGFHSIKFTNSYYPNFISTSPNFIFSKQTVPLQNVLFATLQPCLSKSSPKSCRVTSVSLWRLKNPSGHITATIYFFVKKITSCDYLAHTFFLQDRKIFYASSINTMFLLETFKWETEWRRFWNRMHMFKCINSWFITQHENITVKRQ